MADPILEGPITSPAQVDAVDDDTYASVLAGLETGADPVQQAFAAGGEFSSPDDAIEMPNVTVTPEQARAAAIQVAAEDAAALAPTPGLKQSSSTGSSRSASVSGYSATKNRQIASGPGARLNQQIAQDKAQIEADYAPILKDQEVNFVHQLLANDAIAQQEAAKQAYIAEAKHKVAGAYDRFKNEEEFAYAEAQVAAEQAMQAYRTSLAEWGAMRVNPGALFGNASGQQRISMGAAAFVHDFLGARGIRTSAMDTLNALADRSINAQLANMQHKGQVTAGFKNLWDMQRAQSASDAEARARVRGFVLESLGAEIEGELAKYDSKLVQDKALAARALIEQEKIKAQLEVRKHISQAHNQLAGHRVAAAGDQLRASTAYAQMASSERIAQMNAAVDMAKIGATQDPLAFEADLIADVSKEGGNKASRRFVRGVSPADKTEMRKKSAVMIKIAEGMADLEKLHKEAGNRADVLGTSRFMSEAQRTAGAMEKYLGLALAYARSGKAINETEIKWTQDLFANDTWFTNGENVRKLNSIIERLMIETNAEISANSIKLKPGDQGYGYDFGPDSLGLGLQTESGIKGRGDGAAVADDVDLAAGQIGGRGHGRAAEEGLTFPVPGGGLKDGHQLWQEFRASPQGPKQESASPGILYPEQVPQYFVGMGELAKKAIDDPNNPETNFNDDAEAKKARELLDMWALAGIAPDGVPAPAPNGKDPNDPLTREMIEAARFYSNLVK